MMVRTVKKYRITRVGLVGAQRAYIVTVARRGHQDGDVASFPYGKTAKDMDDAYRRASLCAESIKRGRYVGRRGEWILHVRGKTLTATKEELARRVS